MSWTARLLIAVVVSLGLAVVIQPGEAWVSGFGWRCAAFIVVQILAATMKVRIPGINGSMSVLALTTLPAITQLNLPEVLAGCIAGALYQCTFRVAKRQTAAQLSFNLSISAISASASFALYHYARAHIAFLDSAVALLAAGALQFVINTLPLASVIRLTSERNGPSLREIWLKGYSWSFPFYLIGAGLAAAIGALTHYHAWQTAVVIAPLAYLAFRSLYIFVNRIEEQKKHVEEISGLQLRTIEALALAIEAKDQTTASHLARVQVYAMEIGRDLGMKPRELEALQAAALLHDIGKLAVPEYIISKPGKLTREEFEKMKIHPVVGAEILERVAFPYPVCPIVRSHHEKWNGQGYPDGLRGEEIPLGARILSAVDCLDALASDRQYRRALPLDEAMKRVEAEAGVSFDPRVVEVLSSRYRELEARAQVYREDRPGLSLDAHIERCAEPAAGLAPSQPDLKLPQTPEDSAGFVTAIAAARHELMNICELAQDLGLSLNLEDTVSVLAPRLKRLVPFDTIALYLTQKQVLKPAYVAGEGSRLFSSLEIPIGSGLSGWVAETGRTILNGNPAVESAHVTSSAGGTGMQSAISVPLETPQSRIGVLTLYRLERESFTTDHLRLLTSLAPRIAQAIENLLRVAAAEDLATIDPATRLPNARALFSHLDAELARCHRVGVPLVVVSCDLKNLHRVNVRLGHSAGTEILRATGEGIRAACRPYDFLARTGGNDFIIVMPEIGAQAAATRIRQIEKAVADIPVPAALGEKLRLETGWAVFGEDGRDSDSLLTTAASRRAAAKCEWETIEPVLLSA